MRLTFSQEIHPAYQSCNSHSKPMLHNDCVGLNIDYASCMVRCACQTTNEFRDGREIFCIKTCKDYVIFLTTVACSMLHDQRSKYCHVQVVHNDVKTKNVLLSRNASVAKLSDVGTSRILEQTCTTASASMGYTLAYAAPEQILGKRNLCTEKVCQLPQPIAKRQCTVST